jgi:hypothetical protein
MPKTAPPNTHANTTQLVVMELMVGPAPASSGTMLPFFARRLKNNQAHRKSSMTFQEGKPVFILDDPVGDASILDVC